MTPETPGDDVIDLLQHPVLDTSYLPTKSLSLNILNNCGKDGCQSDVRFTATMAETVIAGEIFKYLSI